MSTTKVICTSECSECIYCTLDESNKAKILVKCSAKNKTYNMGRIHHVMKKLKDFIHYIAKVKNSKKELPV